MTTASPVRQLADLPDGAEFDLVVVGAGAAGMAAAAFAAVARRRVLLVERTDYLGGTSALSAATIWIPNSQHAGEGDSFERARQFLDGVVGNRSSAALRDAFLHSGPAAVALLEAETSVRLRPYALHPDYEQDVDGATLRGRALEPIPFDGRALGDLLALIRPPIPEFTLFGGMMVDRTDIGHLLNCTKNLRSARHTAAVLTRYAADKLAGRRGSRLVMGNALIGRLLLTLRERGATIVLNAEVADLEGAGRIERLVLRSGGVERRVSTTRGVVLTAGGYGRHASRRAEMLPQPTPAYSPAAPGHTGAMQDIALRWGARFGDGNADNAFWAPVSIRKRADGSTAVFPHFVMDRSKPGTICVNQDGDRFVNESTSYHNFARAMFEGAPGACWIVTDAIGLRRYGLGMVRMGTRKLAPFLADGYLIAAGSVPALAAKLGLPADNLARSIATIAAAARSGVDDQFGRGRTAYHRVNGDASRGGPNPTLAVIDTPPFYAVRLHPGDIGAATGLVIDEWARVLDHDDRPISGLYACGNEANSIMGGTYPGPGITIGPAITFAYRAVHHALDLPT